MAVNFTFTGDNRDLLKALEQAQDRITKLEQANKKLGDESKKASASSLAGLDKMVSSAVKAGASVLTIQTAWRLANAEIERNIQLQSKAAGITISTADAQREAMLNLGTASAKEMQLLKDGIDRIAKSRGVSAKMLWEGTPGITSALGDLPIKAGLSAMDVAARTAKHSPDTFKATGSGLLDIAGLTRDSNAEANLGTMLGVGRGTRVQSLKDIAENMVPAAKNVASYGGTSSEALALVSTMSSLTNDPTGRISGTASGQLAEQLSEFMPEKDRFTWDDKGRKKLATKGTGLASTKQRIEFLQANAEMRERFMATGAFEQKAKSGVRDILTGGSVGDKLLDVREADIPTGAAAVKVAQDFFQRIESDPMQAKADMERQLGGAVEEALVGNDPAARSGIVRKNLEDTYEAAGVGSIQSFLRMKRFDFTAGDNPEQTAASMLRTDISNELMGMPKLTNVGRDDQARQLVILTKMLDSLEKQTEKLEGIRQNQRPINPNANVEN